MQKAKVLLAEGAFALLLNITAGLLGRQSAIQASRWGWLLFFLHLTYVLLSGDRVKIAFRKVRPESGGVLVTSYIVVALLGASVAALYWWGLGVAYARLFGNDMQSPASESATDPWHVAIETAIAGGGRGLAKPDKFDPTTISGIWIIFQGSYGDTASPANMALFIRITNRQPSPASIERIKYEALGLNTGKWHTLVRLPLRYLGCYGFDDLKGARLLDFSQNSFPAQIENRSIAPNQSIRGWDLLEYPDGFQLSGTPLRVTITDLLNREFYTVVPFPEKDETGTNTQTRGLVATEKQDLSGYHRDYWTNTHAH